MNGEPGDDIGGRGEKIAASERRKRFTRNVILRVTEEMYAALEADAEAHGRTVVQSARYYIGKGLDQR